MKSKVAIASLLLIGCGGGTSPVPSLYPDSRRADAARADASAAHDARLSDAQASDASSPDAASSPFSESITFVAAGMQPTTILLGDYAAAFGRAQYRQRPAGGGALSIFLGGATASPRLDLELTIVDDAGGMEANETFVADFDGFNGPRKGRLEVFPDDVTRWRSQGDGQLTTLAVTSTSATVAINNMAQGVAGTVDLFVATGTVQVPLSAFAETASGNGTLTFGNLLDEPFTNEPNNLTAPNEPLAMTNVILGDREFPFVGSRRTTAGTQVLNGTSRNLRIAFPTGHLPHRNQPYPLNRFDRVNVIYFEGADLLTATNVWEADMGQLVVVARTATSLTMELQDARMQSEAPGAKGLFTLNGTVTVALPE